MRRVHWSRRALDEIKAQAAYIARDNRTSALQVADRLKDAGDALGRHSTGRPGHHPGTYEKLVSGLPYFLVYRVDDGNIFILRVIHTARNRP